MPEDKYLVLVIVVPDTNEDFEAATSNVVDWDMLARDKSYDETREIVDRLHAEDFR